jgi:hypothetical protein
LRIFYYVREKKDERNLFSTRKIVEVLGVETTIDRNERVLREFSGRLTVKYHGGEPDDWYFNDEEHRPDPDFAFVGDYYIHKNLLVNYGITSNCNVRGRAVLGGDGKWKGFELEVE